MLLDKDQELEDALKAVEEIEPEFGTACKDYYAAKAELKIAEAEAYLKAEGTIPERERTAISKTAEQMRDFAGKEYLYAFLKEKLADRQDAVSARQSLLSAEVKTNSRL